MDFFSFAVGFLASRLLQPPHIKVAPPVWTTPPDWIELCPHASFDPVVQHAGYVECRICEKSWHGPDFVPPIVNGAIP